MTAMERAARATQVELFAARPPAPPPAPTWPCPDCAVRVDGYPGPWRVLRAGDGWVELVGEAGYRTVEARRVRPDRDETTPGPSAASRRGGAHNREGDDHG